MSNTENLGNSQRSILLTSIEVNAKEEPHDLKAPGFVVPPKNMRAQCLGALLPVFGEGCVLNYNFTDQPCSDTTFTIMSQYPL